MIDVNEAQLEVVKMMISEVYWRSRTWKLIASLFYPILICFVSYSYSVVAAEVDVWWV